MPKPDELIDGLNQVLDELREAGVMIKLAQMYPDDRMEVCVIIEGVRIERKRLVLADKNRERRYGR